LHVGNLHCLEISFILLLVVDLKVWLLVANE
jgi:hypothetical protein